MEIKDKFEDLDEKTQPAEEEPDAEVSNPEPESEPKEVDVDSIPF